MHTDTPRLPLHAISLIVYLIISVTGCIGQRQGYSQVWSVLLCTPHILKLDSAQGSEDIYGRVIKTARSLYRCSLSCKDAFPSPDMKEKLAKIVWNEACTREGAHPHLLLRQDKEASLLFCH